VSAVLKLALHLSQTLPVLKELFFDQRLDQANGSTIDCAAQTRRGVPICMPSERHCGRVILRTLREQLLEDLCERDLLELWINQVSDGLLGYRNSFLVLSVRERDHVVLLHKTLR